MTPGTTSKGRKTVSFGSQVMDNEGKRGNTGKSGIPNDCPGKFPSPWTPGTQLKLDPASEKRTRTKLTEALLDARTTTQPKPGQKPKARDDSDITIDLGAPRSESGKYWKEQYESYAERSEKEMKKVIAKQQLAKKYAMKKDGEVTELVTKLEQERKHRRQRERDLEQQNKDFQERLRQATAENMSSNIEIAALKARIATLESSIALPSSELQQSKPSFQIYEDSGTESRQHQSKAHREVDVPSALSVSMASSGKENTPTPRPLRRQSVPHSSRRPILPTRIGTGEDECSIVLGRSPRRSARPIETTTERPLTNLPLEQPSKSPFSARKPDTNRAPVAPSSPVAMLPSSPLPMPSPDPWLEVDGSSIQQMDKMALPVSTGVPYTRPEWNPPPKQHRVTKSTSHARQTQTAGGVQSRSKVATATKVEEIKVAVSEKHPNASNRDVSAVIRGILEIPSTKTPQLEPQQKREPVAQISPTDPKFDLSKITAHHAEGSTQVKRDKVDMLPADRKEQARRRLEARKKLRKNPQA